MNLVWKLLRRHISIPQFAGFFFANLFGMFVVLLGIQFYKDIVPLFVGEDSFINNNYLVVSKHITTAGTLAGRDNTFEEAEINDIKQQPFCKNLGVFTSSLYKTTASIGLKGSSPFASDMFFEAVPDEFVDAPKDEWKYTEGDKYVPVIMPRSYLALYNFGFAQSRGLPKVSDGLVGMIDMSIFIHGDGKSGQFRGKIVGFSNRLNTILVPQSFIDWSNNFYEPGRSEPSSRLIVEVVNPADDGIAKYMSKHGYDVEDNKLDAGKATYFLKIVISIVTFVGLLVSILSFYILMLSIYLLVQKNTTKLENLLLIGYSPSQVSLPYQILTISLNALVLVLAIVIVWPIRSYYMDMMQLMFPQLQDNGMTWVFVVGIALFVLVSVLNVLAIRKKVISVWYRKD